MLPAHGVETPAEGGGLGGGGEESEHLGREEEVTQEGVGQLGRGGGVGVVCGPATLDARI